MHSVWRWRRIFLRQLLISLEVLISRDDLQVLETHSYEYGIGITSYSDCEGFYIIVQH